MNRISLIIAIIAGLALAGCSSIVKKPEVNNIKSVALVSVYANSKVTEKKNRGSVQGWNDNIKQDVSTTFYDAYGKAMNDLGWKVIPASKVTESKFYQSNFRIQTDGSNTTANKLGGFLNKLADMDEKYNYFTQNGLYVLQMSNQELGSTKYVNGKLVGVKQNLADLAKELGVDAVVVVQIDYCYEGGTFSIAGTGKGYMTAASTIRAIDQKGNVVVNMGDMLRCADSENRATSDAGYAMVGGNLVIGFAKDDTVKQMFREATQKNTQKTMAQLKKAMQ